jgi:hypothetical protein
MTSTRHRDVGLVGSTPAIAAIGGLVILGGAVLGVARFYGGVPVERGIEGALGAVAFGTVVAAPGLLALLALDDRPTLLLPAATVLVPLSLLSLAGVLLPLLIPATMLFVAHRRRSSAQPAPGAAWTVLITIALVALMAAAVAALFLHRDPRSYSTATGGGSTSDVITTGESLISLALTSVAIAGGWLVTRPVQYSTSSTS